MIFINTYLEKQEAAPRPKISKVLFSHNGTIPVSIFSTNQSTINPNMPLRGIIYFRRVLDGYTGSQSTNIYGKKLVKIPTPCYYVVYNGTDTCDAVVMHKAEVRGMVLENFNMQIYYDGLKEEGRDENN